MISAGRNFQELIEAVTVADGGPLKPGGGLGQSNLRAGNRRARRVGDAAIQLACGLRCRERGEEHRDRERPDRSPCAPPISKAKPMPPLVPLTTQLQTNLPHRYCLPGEKATHG